MNSHLGAHLRWRGRNDHSVNTLPESLSLDKTILSVNDQYVR